MTVSPGAVRRAHRQRREMLPVMVQGTAGPNRASASATARPIAPRVLIPVADLASSAGMADFVLRVLAARPDVQVLWPSRGPDLRAAAAGALPANAAPFAIDDSPELRTIAASFAAEAAEVEAAYALAASAAALQGAVLHAVDVPSLYPSAHLVRPISDALGVGVGCVIGSWLGDPVRVWSRIEGETPAAAAIAALGRQHVRSTAAVELCHARCATAYGVGGLPAALRLSMTASVSLTLAAAALSPWRPRRPAALVPDVTFVIAMAEDPLPALAATLASLARQRGVATEAVVVDGGSEASQAIRGTVGASGGFVRLVRQGRQGTISGMNRGLHHARAPYVCVLCPGTVVVEDFAQRAVALLERPDDYCAVSVQVASPARPAARIGRRDEPSVFVFRRSVAMGIGGFNTDTPDDLMAEMRQRGYEIAGLDRADRHDDRHLAYSRVAR